MSTVRLALLALAASLGTGVFASPTLLQDDPAEKPPTLAIVPFRLPNELRERNSLGDSNFLAGVGAMVADRLAQEFKSRYPSLRLPERRDLDQALSELKLDESGLMEEGNAARIGQFVKADYVLVGTITAIGVEEITDILRRDPLQGRNHEVVVAITGRLVDVTKGETLTSITVDGRERFKSDGRGAATTQAAKAAGNAAAKIASDILPMFSPEASATRGQTDGSFIVGHGQKHGAKVGDSYRIYKITAVTDGFQERELVGMGEISAVQPERSMVRLRNVTLPKKERGEKFVAVRISRA